MAVTGIVCRSRLLFNIEIRNILCNPGIISNSVKCNNAPFRKWRQCRKLTTSVALASKHKDKDGDQDVQHLSETTHQAESDAVTFTNSYHNGDPEHEEMNVSVAYYRGLPQITVPLPSRHERCRFTLRPISNTVGDFLEMLRSEDRGIDRAAVLAPSGIRIAASDTIEALFENDFTLLINDKVYHVKTPKQERLTSEEIHRLSDVRNLVNQLYEALNVQEHQLHKERELCAKLEHLKQELQPLEETRQELENQAQRRGNVLAWCGLGLMSVQFGILARLTWWEYSWDIMEPVTYFVTYGTAMAAYAYFVLTKEEYLLPDVRDRQHLFTLHKRAKKLGLDINKYNNLKDQINAVELDLNRLRDPLHIHLPHTRTKQCTSLKNLIKEKINANKFFERKLKS